MRNWSVFGTFYVAIGWHIDICQARDAGTQPTSLKNHLANGTWFCVKETVPATTNLDHLLDLESVIRN